ncbi:MAG: protein kinase [Verrucomicrobiota bacterium]
MELPRQANRADGILDAVLDLESSAREEYMIRTCGGDLTLLAEVRALLAAHEAMPTRFLAQSAMEEIAVGELDVTVRSLPVATPTLHAAERAGEMIGHYKLREQIGEGGFGTVWVADQEQPVRRRVALKIIKMGMDTKEVIARFEQERQALAMMDHPNIARVLDAGVTQTGRPYFVMELVRGVKITDYCDDKELSTRERIELFIHVCQAVQHAHQKGIIHRDLKPSNILVTINDGVAVPKVIDFGVAKATQGRLTDGTIYTQFQQMIGTPLYMSPEQAEMTSLDVDTRSDIYALGVLLYELLTGRTPIDNTTMAKAGMDEIRRLIREVDPPKPSQRLKTLDGNELTSMAKRRHTEPAKLPGALRGDLDWIVMKCIEKDRARRYDTANGLALDLQRHLKNEVVIARPPTAGYLLGKLIRRHKVAFAAGAAIAAALLIGIAGTTSGFIRARQQRDVAEKATEAARLARQEAEANEQLAAKSERKAAASATDARYQLTRLHVATGTQANERGDPFTALLWYVRAWQGDPEPAREAAHRMRLGAVLDGMPRLAGVCFHTVGVDDVEIDPAGQRLVTRTMDREGKLGDIAYIWDYAASKLATPPLVHAGPVRFAGFSPDGTFVLTASEDSTAVIWNAATGRKLRTLNHDAPVLAAAFAPDGKTFATAAGAKVTFWNPATGEPAGTAIECPGLVYGLQFSRDGSRLLTADRGGHARVWQSATGQAVGQPIPHRVPTEEEEAFYKPRPALSPDGERILACVDRDAKLVQAHEVATGRLLWEDGADDHVLAWSHNGQQALFSVDGKSTLVVDSDTGKRVHEYGHPRSSPWVALTPDDQTLATGISGGGIYLWNAKTGESLGPPLQCADFLHGMRFSPDGKRLIASSQDGTARVWELAPESSTVPYAFDCGQAHLAIFADGSSASPDGRTRFHPDAAGGTLERANPKQSLRLEHAAPVTASRFSSDGRRLATFASNSVRVWDAVTGEPLGPVVPVDLGFDLQPELEISQDGQRVAVIYLGHANSTAPLPAKRPAAAIVWDAAGRRLFTLPSRIDSSPRIFGVKQDDSVVADATLSPDGRIIVATVRSSGEMSTFDVDTGKRLCRAQVCRGYVFKPVIHPDGRSAVIGASDNIAREFDVFTAAPFGPALRHPLRPEGSAIDLDHRKIATVAGRGLRIWDAKTGDVLVIVAIRAAIRAGCWFSRDGTTVQFMEGKAWKQFRLPSCLGSQDAVRHAAALLTGHFLDANDSLGDVGPNEFMENRASYRKAWLDWLGLPDDPHAQP